MLVGNLRGGMIRGWLFFTGVLTVCAGPLPLHAQQTLPDAPQPQQTQLADLVTDDNPASDTAEAPTAAEGQNSFPPEKANTAPGSSLSGIARNPLPRPRPCQMEACSAAPDSMACCQQSLDPFAHYLTVNGNHPLTPKQKFRLAWRDVFDPFNLLTIVGSSAISIASNADSSYGPGFPGFGKLTGVAFTQDMTGEFFGTFLIPSIAHQDPHFHRLPNASFKRRLAHCATQIVWTQSDTGSGMFNYATIFGTMADEGISNIYVPYREVGWGPASARVATAWATDPIGNVITEFLPDLARHVNVNVVFVQRIINRVAIVEAGPGGAPAP